MRTNRIISILSLLFIFTSPAYAVGVNLYLGKGAPSDLRGGRISLDWPWTKVWYAKSYLNITGYWDLGYAYWHSDGDHLGRHESVHVFGGAPIFRLQLNPDRSGQFIPFLDAGIGLAVHTSTRIAHRDLGHNVTFQDLIGIGALFGNRKQYNLTFQYMHYSNASIVPPNHGLDVKYGARFGYRFA